MFFTGMFFVIKISCALSIFFLIDVLQRSNTYFFVEKADKMIF